MKIDMQKWKERVLLILLISLFSLSFYSLDAAKYDTADRIWLSLLVGVLAPLPLFFGATDAIRRRPYEALLLWIFCLLVWVSWHFSQTKNYGFSEAVVLSSIFFWGLAAANNSKKLHAVIFGIGLISALYGFWYFPTHGEARMAGLFFDAVDPRHFFPNTFANYLLMAWPLALIWENSRFRWIVLGVLFAALYATFSRGAWAVFFVQLIVLAYMERKKILRVGKTFLLAFCIAAVMVFALTSLRAQNFHTLSPIAKITFQHSENQTSLTERRDFWKGAAQLAAEKPLWGYGPMSFRYAYTKLQPVFLAISDHPHNWILKIAAENGILAAVAFLGFLGLIFARGARRYRGNQDQRSFVLAAGGGFLHNLVDYNMNFIPTLLAFALLCGMLLHFDGAPEKPATGAKKTGAAAIFLWIVVAVVTFVLSLREGLFVLNEHTRSAEPMGISVYAPLAMPRDFFLRKAEKATDGSAWAIELIDKHLAQNPLDAFAWYLKGDPQKALELDPMNHFSYYRAYFEKFGLADKQWMQKTKNLLKNYDNILAKNIHYTAFSDNPAEAAHLWKLFGNAPKARELMALAEKIKIQTAMDQDFSKQLVPRTLRQLQWR